MPPSDGTCPGGVPVSIGATGYQGLLLTEYVTLWDVPVGSPRQARYTVSVVASPEACGGLALVVVRR